jgi:hypothetical protein
LPTPLQLLSKLYIRNHAITNLINKVQVSESISWIHIANFHSPSLLPELGEEHWRVSCHPLEPVNTQTLGLLFTALASESVGRYAHTFYIKTVTCFQMYFHVRWPTHYFISPARHFDQDFYVFPFYIAKIIYSRSHTFTISMQY